MITLQIEYFATLREQAGQSRQTLDTELRDARAVYALLANEHQFSLGVDDLKLAVNDRFADWSHTLNDGDRLVFIPPVSGG
ncbi:MAG: MoaD/ThiS family protein [Pseudomonadota bacterium]